MVVACDGIWDCLSSAESSTWVRDAIKERKPDEAKEKVVGDILDELLAEDANNPDHDGTGTDNMTCILVEFTQPDTD